MERYSVLLTILLITFASFAQSEKAKTLDQLIDPKQQAWLEVREWIRETKNNVEILPKDKAKAEKALYESQIPTHSMLGAVIYETGGVLIDHGWIRILGSGSERLNRSLMQWNKGKSFRQIGQQPSYLLIADDAVGGFFAINNGAFGKENIGKVYYFSPDNMEWEPLGLGYTEFLDFCFSADLNEFYKGLRWEDWKKDVIKLDGNSVLSCYPHVCVQEGKGKRNLLKVEEIWKLYFEGGN